jgi:hypothetical protein
MVKELKSCSQDLESFVENEPQADESFGRTVPVFLVRLQPPTGTGTEKATSAPHFTGRRPHADKNCSFSLCFKLTLKSLKMSPFFKIYTMFLIFLGQLRCARGYCRHQGYL